MDPMGYSNFLGEIWHLKNHHVFDHQWWLNHIRSPFNHHLSSLYKIHHKITDMQPFFDVYPLVISHNELERSTMFYLGKSTISMAIFNRYVGHNQRVNLHFPMVFLWFSYGFPIKPSLNPHSDSTEPRSSKAQKGQGIGGSGAARALGAARGWRRRCPVDVGRPGGDDGDLTMRKQGLVNVPFWVYWTSPYRSHYRPYT